MTLQRVRAGRRPLREPAAQNSPMTELPASERSTPREPGALLNEVAAQNAVNVARMDEDASTRATPGERIARIVGGFCGSMNFIWIHLAWFICWGIYNTTPWFSASPPDPFPFSVLALLVSLETVFLSAFILISQRQEARLADRRSQLELQINMLAEQESTKALHLLQRICEKLGIHLDHDPALDELAQATRHEEVMELVERKLDTPPEPGAT